VDEGTPTFRDLDFVGITVGSAPALGLIEGLPERFIRGVRLRDVTATAVKTGISVARAADVSIIDLHADPAEGPVIAARQAEGLRVRGLVSGGAHAGAAIVLEDVAGAFVHGSDVTARPLVERLGTGNSAVTLTGNAPQRRARPA
jgi:hypothetical protein